MHTNFDITPKIMKVIEKTRGVDSVDPVTRYRMRVGFPRTFKGEAPIFKTTQTKHLIQHDLCDLFHFEQDQQLQIFNLDIVRKAREVRDSIDKNNEYWVLYILPNGQMDVVTSATMDDPFIDRVGEFTATHHMAGGVLITSEVD